MINSYITDTVEQLVKHVEGINQIMSDLHDNNVEIRIAYKESTGGKSPQIDLWRVIEHVDYLKKENIK
jgi:multidrug efflux pump subunit AcrB